MNDYIKSMGWFIVETSIFTSNIGSDVTDGMAMVIIIVICIYFRG